MYDLIIRHGTVVDGTGDQRRRADVAVTNGVIVAVGPSLEGEAVTEIDATDRIVTPGFVDCHTHYDGQVTWDDQLNPSSGHGVTTVVMGNCGVGFAPVRPGSEEWLIQLMEGVEDIPGSALSEGITWGWESFPQYLDALEQRELSIDVGTQIAHGAVRGYVMGERGAKNEPAGADDIAAMADLVREAIEAGALGVSTSRTLGHKAIDGEPVPGTFAAEDELFALGQALRDGGGGVFELAPAGAAGMDLIAPPKEMDWMCRLSAEFDQPVSFALTQVDAKPDLWREMMDESLRAVDRGAAVYPQVAARPFGMIVGLQTHHPFTKRPTYVELAANLAFPEVIAEMAKPAVRAAILAEDDLPPDPTKLFDGLNALFALMPDKVFSLGDPPDYEPGPEMSAAAQAEAAGRELFDFFYDMFMDDAGRAMMMMPLFNYSYGNSDATREMLLHPQGVSGLSDGGAHCGMICDASIPTYLLTHWTRDRTRGPKLDLEWVVRKQARDTAHLYGLTDRGTIEVGKKADLNVIDHDNLRLGRPTLAHDLPAGGRRLLQDATGYDYTIVSGQITRRGGVDTGARPGGLVRGGQGG